MLTLPPDPYSHLKSTDKVKLQCYVCPRDKGELMTVIPNRDLYTLLITHSLQRAANFIRTNNLSFDNDADQSRLLQFILTGIDPVAAGPVSPTPEDGLRKRATPRPSRKADARDDAR